MLAKQTEPQGNSRAKYSKTCAHHAAGRPSREKRFMNAADTTALWLVARQVLWPWGSNVAFRCNFSALNIDSLFKLQLVPGQQTPCTTAHKDVTCATKELVFMHAFYGEKSAAATCGLHSWRVFIHFAMVT